MPVSSRLPISSPVCGSGFDELPVLLELEPELGVLEPLDELEPLDPPEEPFDPPDEPDVTITLAFMNGCGVQW